jgi:hypothetical protein
VTPSVASKLKVLKYGLKMVFEVNLHNLLVVGLYQIMVQQNVDIHICVLYETWVWVDVTF